MRMGMSVIIFRSRAVYGLRPSSKTMTDVRHKGDAEQQFVTMADLRGVGHERQLVHVLVGVTQLHAKRQIVHEICTQSMKSGSAANEP